MRVSIFICNLLAGYDIPKDTLLVGNVYQVHRSPKEWPDPEVFNPQRFLNAEGQFETRAGWLPFSTGKRVCVGETVAKTDMLLCIAELFQRFTFLPDESASPLTGAYDTVAFGMLAKPYKITVRPRD